MAGQMPQVDTFKRRWERPNVSGREKNESASKTRALASGSPIPDLTDAASYQKPGWLQEVLHCFFPMKLRASDAHSSLTHKRHRVDFGASALEKQNLVAYLVYAELPLKPDFACSPQFTARRPISFRPKHLHYPFDPAPTGGLQFFRGSQDAPVAQKLQLKAHPACPTAQTAQIHEMQSFEIFACRRGFICSSRSHLRGDADGRVGGKTQAGCFNSLPLLQLK